MIAALFFLRSFSSVNNNSIIYTTIWSLTKIANLYGSSARQIFDLIYREYFIFIHFAYYFFLYKFRLGFKILLHTEILLSHKIMRCFWEDEIFQRRRDRCTTIYLFIGIGAWRGACTMTRISRKTSDTNSYVNMIVRAKILELMESPPSRYGIYF